MPRKETYSGPISAQAQQDLVSEGIENFELPKSVVMKIAKSALPDNVKLQKETVLSLVKGSTVFINYLAAMAHDVAQSKQHKSISASDVLKALETIEFGDMVNKLQGELNIYRDLSKNDKGKKSSNGASTRRASTSGGTSVSAPVKGKGKEKATPNGRPAGPYTSAPLDVATAPPRAAGTADTAMDVDEEDLSVSVVENARRNVEDEGDGGDDDPEDEVIDEDTQSEEEVVDKIALEEDEIRKDAMGVEEREQPKDDD